MLTSEIIIAFMTGIAGPLLLMLTRYYLDKRNKQKDPIRESAEAGTLVVHKLQEMQDVFDFDRIWITQFHNGGHFYPTGKSIQKFSMVYELVNQHAESVRHNFQNIPINLFSRSINHLLEEDVIKVSDFKDETIPTYGLRYIAQETDTKSTYMFALKSIEGRMIGVLSIEYIRRKKALTDHDVNELHLHAGQIGVLLDTYLKKK